MEDTKILTLVDRLSGDIIEKEAKLVQLIICSVKFFAKTEPGLYSECLKCQPEFFSKHRELSGKVWSSSEEEEERYRHRASTGMIR